MNTNFENTPPIILYWIEHHDFEQLSQEQQTEVLNHFSHQEYEAMRRTSQHLRSLSLHKAKESKQRKQQLLDRFDEHHARKKVVPLFPKRLVAWQAASVLLFILCGWLVYRVADLKKDGGRQQTARLDTVFVTQEIKAEPSIVHDTVYLYRQMKQNEKQGEGEQGRDTVNRSSRREPADNNEEEEIYVLPLDEAARQEHRGTSMRDDSLWKHYSFISM